MLFVALYMALSVPFDYDPAFFVKPGYKYPQINENPNIRVVKTRECGFIGNNQYACK